MNREKRRSGRKRLQAVASLVPGGARVADIGTDHGLLPRVLLSTDRASHCIASDCARGPRKRLVEFARRGVFGEKLEFRSGYGLRVLTRDDRLDVVVLSGMGGRSITRILDDRSPTDLGPVRLLLQPQSEPALVRRWIFDRGFAIVDEKLVKDRRRFYVVIAAELGPGPYGSEHPVLDRSEIEEVGPCLVRSSDPLVREFWERVLRHQERILSRAVAGGGRGTAEWRRAMAGRVLDCLGRGDSA
jgi:tRNA (adenine22-N1)-methyltransferase